MTDSEFDLLWLLASEPDQVLSRDILTKALRGIEYDGIDRTVDNKIVLLRKKLGTTLPLPNVLLLSEEKVIFSSLIRGKPSD